ncbi:MAG: phosphodiester glycosidase family protein [Clostridiales bacterium]|jgi:exopolysaccharide biosynthesis protein|nr:phosphodiester glycosidase family protein [Clostridiales bacterium]
MKKGFFKGVFAAILAAGFALSPIHITELQAMPQVFSETRRTHPITRNTYLHRVTRFTNAGLIDISVLEMPLDDPNLTVSAFNSNVEFGLKQTTTTILRDNNAIAGVNGDFFGLAGRHSVPLGLEMIGGEMSAQGGANRYGDDSASFLLNEAGALIDYVRPYVGLRLDGENVFYVGLVNMVTNLNWPSFLTHGYVTSTASLDARLGRTYKLVVEDGRVIGMTHYTVDVPENGFVVIMNPDTFYENEHLFYWGQQAEMIVTANVNLDVIETAISGTSRILSGGQITPAASAARGRDPRTLLGINEEGSRLILMTVDGRNHSIGATLAEAATYMRQFGAHHAINLDGGGSTTMAATMPGGSLSVVNTPSGGGQRAVINTIGITNNTTMGPVTSLNITAPTVVAPPPTPTPPPAPEATPAPTPAPTPPPFGPITSLNINAPQNIPVGIVTPLYVFGYDEYLNRRQVSMDGLDTAASNATMVEGGIIPDGVGNVIVQASDGQNHTFMNFNAVHVVEIIPSVREITGTVGINFRGVDNMGHSVYLNPAHLTYEVSPTGIGRLENGHFTATGEGFGWARASAPGMADVYIPINIYRPARQIDVMDGGQVAFTANPGVTGRAYFSDQQANVGGYSLRVEYNFEQGDRNQHANVALSVSPMVNAITYRVAVYGNYSGHRLTGNILDASGNNHTIEFARNIDFSGWRDLTARVPAHAAQPMRLTDFRIESTFEDDAVEYELFIDNLRVHERLDSEPATVPSGSVARDPLRPQFLGDATGAQYDLTFMGPMTFSGAQAPDDLEFFRNMAISALARASRGAFYGGAGDISARTNIPTVSLSDSFSSLVIHDINLMQISSPTGASNVNSFQWSRLNDALSATTMENIVIHTNVSPLAFGNAHEFALFHDMLVGQVLLGRNVFVVSNGGSRTVVELRDGVRYINLPAMFIGTEINTDFSILRLRFGADGSMQYGLERIFN